MKTQNFQNIIRIFKGLFESFELKTKPKNGLHQRIPMVRAIKKWALRSQGLEI